MAPFFFKAPGAPRSLPSSPPRRSPHPPPVRVRPLPRRQSSCCLDLGPYQSQDFRSEEHTSELQSQSNLAWRLFFLKHRAPPDLSPLPPPAALPTPRQSEFDRSPADNQAVAWISVRTKAKILDRKSTRLNSSHSQISHGAFFF